MDMMAMENFHYRTVGSESGDCGHRHVTIQAALECLFHEWDKNPYTDREVIAVNLAGHWRNLVDVEIAVEEEELTSFSAEFRRYIWRPKRGPFDPPPTPGWVVCAVCDEGVPPGLAASYGPSYCGQHLVIAEESNED